MELDVALVTPSGIPGVLDKPIVETSGGVGAVADGKDGVIECRATRGIVEDTRRVGLERRLVGLNGNGEGLLAKGGLHLADTLRSDVGVGRDVNGCGRGRVVSASLHSTATGDVGVHRLELCLETSLVVFVGI